MKIVVALCASLLSVAVVASSPSPYVGEESRSMKALSERDQVDLLAGKGMGLAKAAELNGYPGPLHVLELAVDLSLSGEQKAATETLFKSMQERAQAVGRELLAAEGVLDELFRSKKITADLLQNSVAEIGVLQSRLRAIHLETHLAQVQLLSSDQIALYQKLRGYSEGAGHRHHDHGGKH
jgi:hypothetical protein